MQKMERKKHYGWGEKEEAMGENTSPQRIQLVEMELKDRNDGKEMKTDNGLQVGLLSVFFFPVLLKHSVQTKEWWLQPDMYWFTLCSFIKLLQNRCSDSVISNLFSHKQYHKPESRAQGSCLCLFHTWKCWKNNSYIQYVITSSHHVKSYSFKLHSTILCYLIV